MKKNLKKLNIVMLIGLIMLFLRAQPGKAEQRNLPEKDAPMIFITELMINPDQLSDSRGEWVEIYNPTQEEIELRGLVFFNQKDEYIVDKELQIKPKQAMVLCKNKTELELIGTRCDLEYSGISLTNGGGQAGLRLNGLKNRVEYKDDQVVSGKSLTYNHCLGFSRDVYPDQSSWLASQAQAQNQTDWHSAGFLTTCDDNQGEEESDLEDEESGQDQESDDQDNNGFNGENLIITEVMPNPEGVDGKENEYIEIHNQNLFTVNLKGYKLQNKKRAEYIFKSKTLLEPGQRRVFYREQYGFNLYNEDGSVTLFNDLGRELIILSFQGRAPSGQSFNHEDDKKFWSDSPTPGKPDDPEEEKQTTDDQGAQDQETTSIVEIKQRQELEALTTGDSVE
ncbi:MAG: hypothetical protein GF332_03680, partial [Candidatus Moranbacteria bacterium]|nr:hypothetical protein [Candidatus Moranbacteria bacterium]